MSLLFLFCLVFFFCTFLFSTVFIWICINRNLYFLDEESSARTGNLLSQGAMGYSRKNPNR